MLSSRSLRRLPAIGWPSAAATAPGGSSSPSPATVPPAYPATPAAASSPATCRKLRRRTRGSGRPTSMLAQGLPCRLVPSLRSPLSQANDDLVDQQGVTGRDAVGDDLQPQRAGADHGVADDDPPPLQAGKGGRGLLGDLLAAGADQAGGDLLAGGAGAAPGRGDIP